MSAGSARHRRDAARGARHARPSGRHSRAHAPSLSPVANAVEHHADRPAVSPLGEGAACTAIRSTTSATPHSANEFTSRREYRASTLSRREARAQQRAQGRADFTRRLVPGVVAATVLLGAGELLVPQSSVETADAGTGPMDARLAEMTMSTLGPVRSAEAASRSSVRPALATATTSASGVQQQVASFEVDAALTSTVEATEDIEQSVRKQAQDAAEAEEARQAAFASPVRGARVTSGYGQRWGRMHNGMDFGADVGHPLYAVAGATVTTATYNSGLGYHVRITLSDGTEVSYGHMSKILVSVGDVVAPGTLLGLVGNSGSSTGAHLHLEVRGPDGVRVDPRPWLAERGLL